MEENKKNVGKTRKFNNNVIESYGKKFWRFDSGECKELPNEQIREKIILEAHEKILHLSAEYTYYEIRKRFYWPRLRENVDRTLKACEICQTYNRKKKGK